MGSEDDAAAAHHRAQRRRRRRSGGEAAGAGWILILDRGAGAMRNALQALFAFFSLRSLVHGKRADIATPRVAARQPGPWA